MSTELTYDDILKLMDKVDTTDLIWELESRGYYVSEDNEPKVSEADSNELATELRSRGYDVLEGGLYEAVYCWNRGDKKEALHWIEREIPELYGVSRLA